MGIFTPFIKTEWIASIKAYKFKGTDNSFIYVNFTSPMCNKLVQYIPSYIA
jgi:hypothetical protein